MKIVAVQLTPRTNDILDLGVVFGEYAAGDQRAAKVSYDAADYRLENIIDPSVSTLQLKARAEIMACRGRVVAVGTPAYRMWYSEHHGQWAVKYPAEPYPRLTYSTQEALNMFVDGWIRGDGQA